jgi:hypothetical protein
MTETEGVIKFQLQHEQGQLPPGFDTHDIRYWFGVCRELDLIGQHPDRYQGAAYGNISQRAPQGFLISGTQTGGQAQLGGNDIAWVIAFDVDANALRSQGPVKPSSESLTHGQIYALAAEVNFIIHIHDRHIWENAAELGLPATSVAAAYGTPEMAREVERLMADPAVRGAGAFSMGGHEDGIVIFGSSAHAAGQRTADLYRRAQAL